MLYRFFALLLLVAVNISQGRFFPNTEALLRLQMSRSGVLLQKPVKMTFLDLIGISPTVVDNDSGMQKYQPSNDDEKQELEEAEDSSIMDLTTTVQYLEETTTSPDDPRGFYSTCRLPADPYGILETYLTGPAMMYHRFGTVPPGTIVKMTCQTGYTMATSDPHETFCLEDGTWSHVLGKCRPVACVLPNWLLMSNSKESSDSFPSVIYDRDQSSAPFPGSKRLFRVGSHLHFVCSQMGETVFPSDVYCMPNGYWSFRPPKKCYKSYYSWNEYRAKSAQKVKRDFPSVVF